MLPFSTLNCPVSKPEISSLNVIAISKVPLVGDVASVVNSAVGAVAS